MMRSMYSGVSSLRAHQVRMDVIGNNIANVNTFGFKTARATFSESLYQTTSNASDGTDMYGGSNPAQVGYGSQVGTIDLMFSNGAFAPTDSATDCMIDGPGLFIVGKKPEADGDDVDITELLLTRVGNFVIDGQGYLCDGSGNVVYGAKGTQEDDGTFTPEDADSEKGRPLAPIRVPMDGDEMKKISNIKITASGDVIGTNADEKNVVFGKIAVSNVPNTNGLEKTQGSYYKIVANTGSVTSHIPGEGTTGMILANGLEMSNVDLAREFSEMITTQRGFQANTKIITVTDEMLQELANLKR